MSVEYTIICDGCARVLEASSISAGFARLAVRDHGGQINLPHGRDLCKECVLARIDAPTETTTSDRRADA